MLHKPFASQVGFAKKHILLCTLFAIASGVSTIGWLYGLRLCDPLQFTLVFRHSDFVILSVVGAIWMREHAQYTPTRRRGAVLFLLALVILFVFESASTNEANGSTNEAKKRTNENVDAKQDAAMNGERREETVDASAASRIGMLLLIALTFVEVALNAAARRLAALIGGPNRLQALSSIIVFALLIPVGLPALISDHVRYIFDTVTVTDVDAKKCPLRTVTSEIRFTTL